MPVKNVIASPGFGAPTWIVTRGFGTSVSPILTPTLAVSDNEDGTGGVATVTTSSVGSTNTLYYAVWTGGNGSITWVQLSSRTGNGSIVISGLQGNFIWMVISTLSGLFAISNVVHQPLTDAATSSVLNTILDETVTALNGLGLTLGSGSVTAYKKKVPRKSFEVDALTYINVTGEPLVDEMKFMAFGVVQMIYKVQITVINEGNFDFVTNLPTYTLWRQQIRTLFSVTPDHPSVYSPPVWDQDVVMGDFIDRGEFGNDSQDFQVLSIYAKTHEVDG